jgi:hypothetical protein
MPLLKSNSDYENVMRCCLTANVGLSYRLTPIGSTPAADAADPFPSGGILPDGWWKRGEPREADGREILRLLDHASKSPRYGRDSKKRRAYDSAESESSGNGGVANDDDEFTKYLPQGKEKLSDWLPELSKQLNTNGTGKVFFDTLRDFCGRFTGKAFDEIDEASQAVIQSLIKLIVKEAGA